MGGFSVRKLTKISYNVAPRYLKFRQKEISWKHFAKSHNYHPQHFDNPRQNRRAVIVQNFRILPSPWPVFTLLYLASIPWLKTEYTSKHLQRFKGFPSASKHFPRSWCSLQLTVMSLRVWRVPRIPSNVCEIQLTICYGTYGTACSLCLFRIF